MSPDGGAEAALVRERCLRLLATANGNALADELQTSLRSSPYQTSLSPVVIHRTDYDVIAQGLSTVHQALERVIDLYGVNADVTAAYPHYEPWRHLIERPPPHRPRAQVCRYDGCWSGGTDFKIMETNSGGPGGAVSLPRIARRWLRSRWADALFDGITVNRYPLSDNPDLFAVETLAKARAAGADIDTAVVVKLLDAVSVDLDYAVDSYRRAGVHARVHDARDLIPRPGQLIYSKTPVVRLLNDEPSRRYVEGLVRGGAHVVNPLAVQTITEDKTALAILSDPRFAHLFSVEEKAAVARHVPWTRVAADGHTTSPTGNEVSLRDYVRRNKDDLVLKPINLYQGIGVSLGRFAEEQAWHHAVEEAFDGLFLVQQYLPLPRARIPSRIPGDVVQAHVDLACFMIGGSVAGPISRASRTPIVNLRSDGSFFRPVVKVG